MCAVCLGVYVMNVCMCMCDDCVCVMRVFVCVMSVCVCVSIACMYLIAFLCVSVRRIFELFCLFV